MVRSLGPIWSLDANTSPCTWPEYSAPGLAIGIHPLSGHVVQASGGRRYPVGKMAIAAGVVQHEGLAIGPNLVVIPLGQVRGQDGLCAGGEWQFARARVEAGRLARE